MSIDYAGTSPVSPVDARTSEHLGRELSQLDHRLARLSFQLTASHCDRMLALLHLRLDNETRTAKALADARVDLEARS